MTCLNPGETTEIQGSGAKPYIIKNVDNVNWTCSCPAWRNQSVKGPRTCKHLKKLRGEAVEMVRVSGFSSSTVHAQPIPSVASKKQGGVKNKPPLLLAHKFEDVQVDPTGWWMSEKLDGVRAYWDGENFISRDGNDFNAPDDFKKYMPKTPLDGELWLGRQMFQKTISVVRSDNWSSLVYRVFDLPHSEEPFEDRMSNIKNIILQINCKHIQVHEHNTISSLSELMCELSNLEAAGAEGIIIRQPGSKYTSGRSSTILKVKPFHDDEATVIAHNPGKGKHKGELGGLIVKLDDGVEFNVGSGFKAKERRNPPPIGSRITFRYTGKTDDGIPKCVSFVAVRDYE